ncbi:hypothetical protein [Helicobacter sp. T3_23-1056]
MSLRESRLLLKRLDSWQSTKDFCHIERKRNISSLRATTLLLSLRALQRNAWQSITNFVILKQNEVSINFKTQTEIFRAQYDKPKTKPQYDKETSVITDKDSASVIASKSQDLRGNLRSRSHCERTQ